MARGFASGSSQYLDRADAVADVPLTLACWFKVTSSGANQCLVEIADTDGQEEHALFIDSGLSIIYAWTNDGGSPAISSKSGVLSGTWQHAAAVFASSLSRTGYLEGLGGTESTTDLTPTNLDRTTIGCRNYNSGQSAYTNGDLAEVAIWDAALTANEIAILAKGFSPLFIRPENLVAYWSLIRDGDQDRVGGYDMTAHNSPTVASHPSVLYPAAKQTSAPSIGEITYSVVVAGYAVLKETAGAVAAGYGVLKETIASSAAVQAILKETAAFTAAAHAVIKETAGAIAAEYAVLKETAEDTAVGRAVLKMTLTIAMPARAALKETTDAVANAYAMLKEIISAAAGAFAVLKGTASQSAAFRAVVKMANSVTTAVLAYLHDRIILTPVLFSVIKGAGVATPALLSYLAGEVAAVIDMTAPPRGFTTMAAKRRMDMEALLRGAMLAAGERQVTAKAPLRGFSTTAEKRDA